MKFFRSSDAVRPSHSLHSLAQYGGKGGNSKWGVVLQKDDAKLPVRLRFCQEEGPVLVSLPISLGILTYDKFCSSSAKSNHSH